MSLSSALPRPINTSYDPDRSSNEKTLHGAPTMGALVTAKVSAPPYGQRKGWIPRNEADFADGGSFPEVRKLISPKSIFSIIKY